MDRRTLLLVAGLAGLLVVILLVRRESPSSGEEGSTVDTSEARSGPQTRPVDAGNFQVLSESLTTTGRVYVVMRAGLTRTSIIPAFVEFTPEQLEEFSFGTPESDSPPAPQGRVGLHRHLVFYGVALDDETNGVADAFVDTIIQVSDEQGQRAVTNRITSAADGRFTVEQPWGQLLMITMSKPTNYVAAPPQWFHYGPVGSRPIHVPLPRDPVPFFLHPVQVPEPLFAFRRWFGAPNDGSPVRIDLTSGDRVPQGGDLVVFIWCPEPYTNLRQFPWRLTFEAVDGGLVEVEGTELRMEHLHKAPVDGYQPGFQVENGPNSAEYRRQHDGWFYVRSRSGQVHAKIRFEMRTFWDERGVPFGIRAVVNTNGSRNLQTTNGSRNLRSPDSPW